MYNGEQSGNKMIEVGVPQGGVISPLLFNVYTADIPNVEGIMRAEYADDVAFIVRENTEEGALGRFSFSFSINL